MPFNQGHFDFEARGDESGWKRWREDLDRQKQEFESRLGVRVGKVVTVILVHHAKPVTGRLEWIEREKAPKQGPPRFRIGTLEFDHGEIESIVVTDDSS